MERSSGARSLLFRRGLGLAGLGPHGSPLGGLLLDQLALRLGQLSCDAFRSLKRIRCSRPTGDQVPTIRLGGLCRYSLAKLEALS